MSQLMLHDSLPNVVKEKVLKKVRTKEWQEDYIEGKLNNAADGDEIWYLARAYYESVLIPEMLAENDSIIIEAYMEHHYSLDELDDATDLLEEIKEDLDITEEPE